MLESINRRNALGLISTLPFVVFAQPKQGMSSVLPKKIIPGDYVIVPDRKDLSKLTVIEQAGVVLINGFKNKLQEDKRSLDLLKTASICEDTYRYKVYRMGFYGYIIYKEPKYVDGPPMIGSAIDFPLSKLRHSSELYKMKDYMVQQNLFAKQIENMFKNYENYIGYSQEEIDKIVDSFA